MGVGMIVIALNCEAQMTLTPYGFMSDSAQAYLVWEFPDRSKQELYESSLNHFKRKYDNPDKVLQLVDNHSIFVNALLSVRYNVWNSMFGYKIRYEIDVSFKEGRMKVEPKIESIIELIMDLPGGRKMATSEIWVIENGEATIKRGDIVRGINKWINGYTEELRKSIISDNEW